jgi:YidC/Oxa1 family membrane protein insertase
MSTEKRLILFMVLSFLSMWAVSELTTRLGLVPPPAKRKPADEKKAVADKKAPPGAVKDKGAEKPEKAEKEVAKPAEIAKKEAEPKAGAKPDDGPRLGAPKIAPVPVTDLVLGSTDRNSGYHLLLRLDQRGAGVDILASSLYDAERVAGQRIDRPLELIEHDDRPGTPPSFSITLRSPTEADKAGAPAGGDANGDDDAAKQGIGPLAFSLDQELWEVVKDGNQPAVRPTPTGDGQEISFRTTVGAAPKTVTVTKTYRLLKGRDGFEFELSLSSPGADQSLIYELMGPHGLPIEGEWYTGTFREVFVGQVRAGTTSVATQTAVDVVKARNNPERYQTLPLKFAGVENQYFAVFLEPDPVPQSNDDKWDAETVAIPIHEDATEKQKSDVSVMVTSRPLAVGPNKPVTHRYKVFGGSKTVASLQPFGAEALAGYRKSTWFFIPGAASMAQYVIAPLLDQTYALTKMVAGTFGGKRGSYGIAIILLTVFVRLCLFPLGRKMARSAQKMQQLAPLLKELQAKYKDDKEKLGREQLALYKKYGVNPVGGCLPALIQMPILVGLWQALNNSVKLRHAPFLWIDNLAAPDMLFDMHFEMPFIGHWFNVLPIVVVALMMVQTKLFSPPATTPEAEMQQKMMKYMMVVMAVMFYKVPSGLGIYFITSSLWQICERLMLPKPTTALPPTKEQAEEAEFGGSVDNGKGGSRKSVPENDGPRGWLSNVKDQIEKIMDEARHDKTVRNPNGAPREDDRDRNRPRPKPGKRR